MPVIRRHDDDEVEVLRFQHLAVVGVRPRLLFRYLAHGDELGGIVEHPAVDVTQRHDVHRRHLNKPEQVGLAVPAGTDQADAFLGAGELIGIWNVRQGERGGAVLEEVSAIHGRIIQGRRKKEEGGRSPTSTEGRRKDVGPPFRAGVSKSATKLIRARPAWRRAYGGARSGSRS